MTDWFQNDELFFSELEKGHQYALAVGIVMLKEGLPVRVPRSTRRESIEDRHRYADEIDVFVGDYAIEVKSRALNFTTPSDYPYSTAFVDTESGWAKKDPVPVAVVLVSQETKAMLAVPTRTEPQWTRTTRRDRQRDITDTWLEVNRRQLRPVQALIEWLQVRVNA